MLFFFSSRRRHTRCGRDWSSDVCSSDLVQMNNRTSNLLTDHGPAALSNAGPTVVTYSIGTQAGVLSAAVTSNQTMTYFLKNTNVTDTSSGSSVSWVHSINGQTSVGKLTSQIMP